MDAMVGARRDFAKQLRNLPRLVVRPWALVLGASLLALCLRLFRLDAQSLWLDEGSTWAEVTGRTGKTLGTLTLELFSPDSGYPLYHLLLRCWLALAGDSEWALRFPSALAGALAVGAVLLAANELGPCSPRQLALLGLLAICSPYALWHAQDAKAYSLLLATEALMLWLTLRALRIGTRRAWGWAIAVAVAALFVHRLSVLGLAGVVFGLARVGLGRSTLAGRRWGFALASAGGALLVIGVIGTLAAARNDRSGASAAGVAVWDVPWLTLARFALDRWPGDLDGYLGLPAAVWLAPALLLTLLGLWRLWRLARSPDVCGSAAAVVLGMALFPVLALTIAAAFAPVFQARYAAPAFPAWLVLIACAIAPDGALRASRPVGLSPNRLLSPSSRPVALVFILLLMASVAALVQPARGLFSGDPVKEQWHEAIAETARRVQPDDLLIVQPYYVLPMWEYYAPRVTADPLPQPVTFPIFGAGDTGKLRNPTEADLRAFIKNRYEPYFNQVAYGKKRALLLIAPDHARTVDPPPLPQDRFGWLGLRFDHAAQERAWPCADVGFVGVRLLCASYPETFNRGGPGAVPQPQTRLEASFGGELHLRGYTILPPGGALRPGGTLPITLYWQAERAPTQNYRVFVHLCRDCALPPLAGADGFPLDGLERAGLTSTWIVGDPLHDERSLALPRDLPSGRYTLLIGVYAGDGSIGSRLPAESDAPQLAGRRLVLGEVVVGH